MSDLNAIDNLFEKKINYLEKLNLMLETYNPLKIADMGYSKVLKDGKVITSIKTLKSNDNLYISMKDGGVSCKVFEGNG
jgi:exonuclease VII large subunit